MPTLEFVVTATSEEAKAAIKQFATEIEGVGSVSDKTTRKTSQGAAAQGSAIKSLGQNYLNLRTALNDAQQAIGMVWDTATAGAANLRIQDQFKQTAESIHGNADEIVAAMTRASAGTVDDEALMLAATRSMTLGVAQSSDDLVKLMDFARGATKRFGGDTAEAFAGINESIANLQVRQLKQYGLIIDQTKVYKEYAASIGLTVDQLTEEQMRTALRNEVLDQSAKLFDKTSNATLDAADRMKQFEVRLGEVADTLKERVAVGLDAILFGSERLAASFAGHQQAMREAVLRGKMSLEEYNAEIIRSGKVAGTLVDETDRMGFSLKDMSDDLGDNAAKLRSLEQTYGFADGTLIEVNGHVLYLKGSVQLLTQTELALQNALAYSTTQAYHYATAEDQRAMSLLAAADADKKATTEANLHTAAMKAANDVRVAASSVAIQYTQDERDLADLQKQLLDLDTTLAAQGSAHTVIRQNQTLSIEDQAMAQGKLAVATENLNGVTQKESETSAEYSLRIAGLKSDIADLNGTLGTHAAVVGGVTKAQKEQKAALEAQIAAFQHATEIQKATEIAQALDKAYQAGTLSITDYSSRMTTLNGISGLYSQSALAAAIGQQELLKAMGDPAAANWLDILLKQRGAIDGVANAVDLVPAKIHLTKQAAIDMAKDFEGASVASQQAIDTVTTALAKVSAAPPPKIAEHFGLMDQMIGGRDAKTGIAGSLNQVATVSIPNFVSAFGVAATNISGDQGVGLIKNMINSVSDTTIPLLINAAQTMEGLVLGNWGSISLGVVGARDDVNAVHTAIDQVPRSVIIDFYIRTHGEIPTPTSADYPTHGVGGLTREGFAYLHDDEVVLNSQQRRGLAPIPQGWLPNLDMQQVQNSNANTSIDQRQQSFALIINEAGQVPDIDQSYARLQQLAAASE